MATVLKRPMFKLGGSSDGVGITSGFKRTGYQLGSGGHEREILELKKQIEEGQGGTEKIIDTSNLDITAGGDGAYWQDETKDIFEKIKNPEKEKYGKPDLLWDMYETSKGATDWKDWITGGADLALERRKAKKLEDKERPGKIMDAALAGGKGMNEYLRATSDPQTIARMNLMKNVMVTMDKWREDNPEAGINEFLESGQTFEIDASMRSANPAWPGITNILLDIEDMVKDFDKGAYDDDPLTLPKKPHEIKAYRNAQLQRLIGAYLGFKGNAMGGKPIRRGYNMGIGPAMDQHTDMSMTENIQTPGGDMSMTENIDTNMVEAPSQTMPSDDPFVLLRARLPKEIPDDVVRLIAYNPEAFTDFADIETQDDVIAFNKKYGVELVVNTDEMSGAIA